MNARTLLLTPHQAARRLAGSEVDALVDRMLAAPSVDPGQVPMHGSSRHDSGAMRLALAVLEDALRCVLRHTGSRIEEQRDAAAEALAWLRSDDDAPPFSFVRICQLFDLDPDWIRETVQRHLRPALARRADVRAQRAA